MLGAVLVKFGQPLELVDVTLPSDLQPGQVLVAVKRSSICGAQLGEIMGAKGRDPYLPHMLGHEGGGVVEKVGPGVCKIKPGDRVVMHWRKGSGIEASPAYYRTSSELFDGIGGGPVHTFCKKAVVSENRLTQIDKNIPFEIAALMGCAVTTGFGIICNEAQLRIGQRVTIIGCGGVGLSAILGAKLAGASIVYAIDINKDALVMASRMGAVVAHYDDLTFKMCGDSDIVIECTGVPDVINTALNLTASGGKLILVGQPHHICDVTFTRMRKHYNGKTILDSQGGLTNPDVDIPRYLRLWRTGKLPLMGLITKYFPLEDVNRAIESIRSGVAGKHMLVMDK